MLPSPKIVVVDDDPEDLRAIVDCFYALRTTAFGLHYSLENADLPPFRCLRLLFLDLHLLAGAGDREQQIKNTIGVLANLLTPENGPYAIVLWTSHAGDSDFFRREVERRLPLVGLPLPLRIVALDKTEFIQTSERGRLVEKPEELQTHVMDRIRECPQLAALLAWEDHVVQAADDAVREVFRLASRIPTSSGMEGLAEGLNQTLARLAVAAAGLRDAKSDVFRAVNEVLVPLVADRVVHKGADQVTSGIWQKAVTTFDDKGQLDEESAASLNRFLHVAEGTHATPWGRGSLLDLSGLDDGQFVTLWGLSKTEAFSEFGLSEEQLKKIGSGSIEWLMAQVQAPCDQAQERRGPLPFVLGIKVTPPSTSWVRKTDGERSLWMSPILPGASGACRMVFNLRLVTGVSRATLDELGLPVCSRLREQVLADMIHRLHSHGSRPGIIDFRPKA